MAVIAADKGPAASSFAKPTANISKARKAASTTANISKHTGKTGTAPEHLGVREAATPAYCIHVFEAAHHAASSNRHGRA